MTIRHAANVPTPQRAAPPPVRRPVAATAPRVLQSQQPPAQLSFFFRRG